MQDCLRVRTLTFSHGCREEIVDRTALLHLEVLFPVPEDVLDRFERGNGLPIAEVFPDRAAGDWITPILHGGRGTSRLADITGALIAVLQLGSRVPAFQAQVIAANPLEIRLALPWFRQKLLKDAVELTIACLSAPETAADEISERIATFLARERRGGVIPNSMRFARAAHARGMPVALLNQRTIRIGWGAHARLFRSSFTDHTGSLAERLARDKFYCTQRLKAARLPVPEQRYARTLNQARTAAKALGWPLVLKPVGLDQGQGVHVGIHSNEALERAYETITGLQDEGVVIEQFVPGYDHRLLVVNGRLMMAARRLPGGVTGDGQQTVQSLLDQLNADPIRGDDQRSLLMRIPCDDEALSCLNEVGLTLDSVPDAGRFVPLRRTANISTGGTATDVTDQVHPDNRIAALRATRIIGLDIAGVDFICPDISQSYRKTGGAICEVNAQPGFRPHWQSDPGRDINGDILDLLFADHPARIPTAAITGTNGKSTTALMLHRIWQAAGKTAGVCATAGTWIGPDKVDPQNLSGRPGAELLLADPAVEAAILEMPRLGLIRFGQACDHYDVAAFLNVQNDHLGQNGIETLEQMAALKSGVLRRARNAVVINAEDRLCLETTADIETPRRILVAMSEENPALAAHLKAGGDGIFTVEQGGDVQIVMARGARRVPVMKVAQIPATLGGLLQFNVMNAMFAIALADAQNLPGNAIRAALSKFENSRDMNPGRYNIIDEFPFRIIVDYAHTPEAVAELCRVMRALPDTGRRFLALQVMGNAGPEKLIASAPDMLATCEQVAILHNSAAIRKYRYFTGPDPEEEMRQTTRTAMKEQGASDDQILTNPNPDTLVDQLLHNAAPGDVVALLIPPEAAFAHIDRFRASVDRA